MSDPWSGVMSGRTAWGVGLAATVSLAGVAAGHGAYQLDEGRLHSFAPSVEATDLGGLGATPAAIVAASAISMQDQAAAAPPPPKSELLLGEIRDLLAKR